MSESYLNTVLLLKESNNHPELVNKDNYEYVTIDDKDILYVDIGVLVNYARDSINKKER